MISTQASVLCHASATMAKRALAAPLTPPQHSADAARESIDLSEVPAAVVCAGCGDALCAGCAGASEVTRPSGVVAVVPWERETLGFWTRLWSTARLATLNCEAFFGSLPSGEVVAALRFAIACELLAGAGLALTVLPLVLAIAPELAIYFKQDPAFRRATWQAFGYGIPLLATLMVLIHGAHGLGLELGARRQGSRRKSWSGLRFGLYGCSWDLVTLPVGLLVLLFSDGSAAAGRAIPLALRAPNRAARAYLRERHQLNDPQIARAMSYGLWVAVAVMTACLAASAAIAVLALR